MKALLAIALLAAFGIAVFADAASDQITFQLTQIQAKQAAQDELIRTYQANMTGQINELKAKQLSKDDVGELLKYYLDGWGGTITAVIADRTAFDKVFFPFASGALFGGAILMVALLFTKRVVV